MRSEPLASLWMVTVAFPTTALVASKTVPAMAPWVVDWAWPNAARPRVAASVRKLRVARRPGVKVADDHLEIS